MTVADLDDTPGARLVQLLKEAGFRPTGQWDAFALAFVGELPSSDGARRFARLVFPKDANGQAAVEPSSVLITVQHNIPADDAAGLAHALGDEEASTALMNVLAPHIHAAPPRRGDDAPPRPVAGATEVCVQCRMRVASWGVVQGDPVCIVCLPAVTLTARARPTKRAPTASSKRAPASAGAKR